MIPFVLADHSLISAVPFLVPALVIIGFLAFHVIRDRRSSDEHGDEGHDDALEADDWSEPGQESDPVHRDA